MKIRNFYPGSWGSNCYLLQSGGFAAIVDPSADAATLKKALDEEKLHLSYILLTHGHFDHIVSVDTLRHTTGAPVLIHASERDFLADSHKNAFYDFFYMERSYGDPDGTLTGGQVLTLGEEEIRVIHTPGHTAGSVCFLCNDELLITGDTLFNGGYGRTDLYSGSQAQLTSSLRSLAQLPGYLPIYPGHGSSTTLAEALSGIGY